MADLFGNDPSKPARQKEEAAPFRVWFSRLASERIEEIKNPDLALKRGYEGYLKKGMSPKKAMARAKGSAVGARVLADLQRTLEA